ncbi:MAG: tRNA (N(6)-L-threonylcarbamoyladenosine(37)-C(2))-methylthiotransferase MtaB [Alphaproteobacteria bacterium CG_4_10_14_0_2_um_filter_63_37]|nr:MAG: tRNA (N(6)-L-threonylcarbamoyladenosine(37)-C(2))-methylthiotransferase MtaB [Proteobacteria bacterium CG1_02_64_396]PJA25244.1 MAG: tRNA (N(6)-L-threonylcarbamoyladenosine(37)-C(2))-methylthiotransferase MtaB [Alphaproteobacteria bacterium CG_4_10_14_0_2_um_filter_63_37]
MAPTKPSTTGRAAVVHMGCRVNRFEAAWIEQTLSGAGWEVMAEPSGSDLVVVNTCTVTTESDRQARQLIRRLSAANPSGKIAVTGCYAQVDPQAVAAIPGVDLVFGNGEKGRLLDLLDADSGTVAVGAPEERDVFDEVDLEAFAHQTRAYIQIQNGCDQKCTFCIIPAARGPSRSLSHQRVLEQSARLLAAGHRELVVTGVDLGDWHDGEVGFSALVAQLLELAGLERLRISSLDPAHIDSRLMDLFTHPKLMPHLHLSLQAGADRTLTRMKRRARRDEILAVGLALQHANPTITFGADVIVGFPGEDYGDFLQTWDLVRRLQITHLHVFRYSPRPGTPAARFPDPVDYLAARRRAKHLRRLGDRLLARRLDGLVGQTVEVLTEAGSEGQWRGRTAADFEVVGQGSIPKGRLIRVEIVEREGGVLKGKTPSGLAKIGIHTTV